MATESQQTVTIRIPIEFDLETRELIADDVLEFIRNRTARGLDKNNVKFTGYSDSYVESLEFKIAGKSKNRVNLELSGDMMTELKVLNFTIPGFIVIGFDVGEENDKAAWNRNNLRSTFPKRDFLGIVDTDLNKILAKYRSRVEKANREEKKRRERIQEEAKRILSRIEF